eukprot:XP_013964251.1 PDZ and LIM domain protein 1 [Canis lupus familiaris]
MATQQIVLQGPGQQGSAIAGANDLDHHLAVSPLSSSRVRKTQDAPDCAPPSALGGEPGPRRWSRAPSSAPPTARSSLLAPRSPLPAAALVGSPRKRGPGCGRASSAAGQEGPRRPRAPLPAALLRESPGGAGRTGSGWTAPKRVEWAGRGPDLTSLIGFAEKPRFLRPAQVSARAFPSSRGGGRAAFCPAFPGRKRRAAVPRNTAWGGAPTLPPEGTRGRDTKPFLKRRRIDCQSVKRAVTAYLFKCFKKSVRVALCNGVESTALNSLVTPGSKAAAANLCIGDVITAIDGENTSGMTHLEAQNKIKGCTDNMTLTVTRSEQKIWSPLVTEEGKRHPYKMNLASEPQEVLHIGSAHNRSAMPFTASPASSSAPRVITNQYNNPAGLYSSENISNFNNALESKTAASGQETNGRALDHSQPPSGLVIDKESEVYKMLQEKQELNEPPKQSTSFLVLQEILESEEKGDPNKPSGFRSVKAPVTKVAASIGNAQKLPMCDKCGTGIVGVFVKLRDRHRHPECYVCTDCGTNLKQKGHFFVEDQIYCEKHARERVTPPEGYDVVTVFPK